MPRIPTYDVGQVRNNALPESRQSANATAGSFGAADAQNLQELGREGLRMGSAMNRIAVDEIDRNNRMMARNAVNEAEAQARAFYSQNVATKQGQDAFGATDTTQGFFEKLAKDMDKKLPNGAAREIFQSHFQDLHSRYMARSFDHSFAEKKKFEMQTIEGDNANMVQRVIEGSMKDDEMAKGVEANIRYAMQGQPKELVDAKVREALTGSIGNVAETLAQTNPDAADALLKAHQEKLDGKFVAMQSERFKKLSQVKQVDAFVSTASQLDYEAGVQKATEVFKDQPTMLNRAINLLKDHHYNMNLGNRIKKEQNEQGVLKSLMENPNQEIQSDDPEFMAKAQAFKSAMLRNRAEGKDNKTDPNVLQEYSNIITDTELLLQTNVIDWADKVSQSDLRRMMEAQNRARLMQIGKGEEKAKAKKDYEELVTPRQVVSAYIEKGNLQPELALQLTLEAEEFYNQLPPEKQNAKFLDEAIREKVLAKFITDKMNRVSGASKQNQSSQQSTQQKQQPPPKAGDKAMGADGDVYELVPIKQ
jgi:hypothetical protein